jgi:hypothetical protein
MDSNQLTLGQIKELSKLIAPAPAASDPAEVERDLGPQIVVLRHGYVYKGYAYIKDGFIYIDDAWNLRRWATTKGMQQMAIEGPQKGASIDGPTPVYAPLHSLVLTIPVDESLWTAYPSKRSA